MFKFIKNICCSLGIHIMPDHEMIFEKGKYCGEVATCSCGAKGDCNPFTNEITWEK